MCSAHHGMHEYVILAGIRASTLRTVGITTRPVQRWQRPHDGPRNSLGGWLGLTSPGRLKLTTIDGLLRYLRRLT